MKKVLLLLPLAFLFGCHSESHNLNIASIDQQIIKLRSHILDISNDEGVYQNGNIDLTLLKEIKETTKEKGEDNIELYSAGKLNSADFEDTVNKMLSVLYFIWMEELDSAQSNIEVERINALQAEHSETTDSEEIQAYLAKQDKLNDYANVREIFKKIPELINQRVEIDNLNTELEGIKNELEDLKLNNQIGDYNDKVEIYNSKIEENENLIRAYNDDMTEYNNEYVYNTFIKLIDINIIFPNQDSITLTK